MPMVHMAWMVHSQYPISRDLPLDTLHRFIIGVRGPLPPASYDLSEILFANPIGRIPVTMLKSAPTVAF